MPKTGVEIDRKVLADLAVHEPVAFEALKIKFAGVQYNDKEAMADPATDPASLERVLATENASTLSELESAACCAWKKGRVSNF